MEEKKRAPRNRTITLSEDEVKKYSQKLITLENKAKVSSILNKTIHQDVFRVIPFLPDKFVDLMFVDPPYNIYKKFNSTSFGRKSVDEYSEWLESFIPDLKRILKPNASLYFCGDWNSSLSIYNVLSKYFIVRNRITWEREKGRGSKTNWKNNSEDIWFCTMSDDYIFNPDEVKLKRKVLAPYREENGEPKDWKKQESELYRLTYPSNIWTDISIPFWSMPENTDHPTQKPEKLLAKIILCSSNKKMVVFDPFCGSGTTSVVARKLDRKFVGIELDLFFSCITEKRLEIAETEKNIQGYFDGTFWERNSYPIVKILKNKGKSAE